MRTEIDPTMVEIAKRFWKSGMTIVEFGRRMGYTTAIRQSAWQFLHRTHSPRISMVRRAATALGCEVEDLVFDDEPTIVSTGMQNSLPVATACEPPQCAGKASERQDARRQRGVTLTSINAEVKFMRELRVTTAELATWEPERITQFFDGVAQVLRAVRGDCQPVVDIRTGESEK